MEDYEIRLACIKLAYVNHSGEEAVGNAQAYYEFVTTKSTDYPGLVPKPIEEIGKD